MGFVGDEIVITEFKKNFTRLKEEGISREGLLQYTVGFLQGLYLGSRMVIDLEASEFMPALAYAGVFNNIAEYTFRELRVPSEELERKIGLIEMAFRSQA